MRTDDAMNHGTQWESQELRVVWAGPRYAVSNEPRPGYWAVFTRAGGEAGILETDGVASLSFEGRGGETDLSVYASGLIMQFAAFGYPAAPTAFNLVRGLLERDDGLTSRLVYGQLPRRLDDGR